MGSETVGRPVLIYPDITTDELIPQAKHKTVPVSPHASSVKLTEDKRVVECMRHREADTREGVVDDAGPGDPCGCVQG